MEQTPHSPGSTPELPTVSPQTSRESLGSLGNPEVQSGSAIEHKERRGESAPAAASTQAAAPQQLPEPVVPVPPSGTSAAQSGLADDDLPSVAADDDLIEKEWVTKTKKVLAETKDDPYRREQEVGRIQYEYILKRYGRKLGSRDEDRSAA